MLFPHQDNTILSSTGSTDNQVVIYEKKPPETMSAPEASTEKRQLPTLPHCIAVPSAMAGLTSLFGMGRGGTPPL